MGGRCSDGLAFVRRSGLAMAAFAGAGPGGDTGRRGISILAAGGWSHRSPGHAAAEHWTALTRVRYQSTLMFANLITFAHLSISSAINLPNSADVIGAGSRPRGSMCDCKIGSAMQARVAVSSLAMT